jgi:hydroxyacylglutathione hydrolase
MLIERSLNPRSLTNTYLVARGPGEEALFIDAAGPLDALVQAAERHRLSPTHVLLTHHHFDQVVELDALRERWPALVVLADPREEIDGARPFHDGAYAGVPVRGLRTPGHTRGALAYLVDTGDVFTGDTLFKGSVGAVRGPGHTTYADLRRSVMSMLMALPGDTVVHPGHDEPTTIADEWERNPFVRIWRTLDEQGHEQCRAFGSDATLVLWCDDYDGGHKAWIRWPDGRDEIVPGSQVEWAGAR